MNSRPSVSCQSRPQLFLDHGIDESACERFCMEEKGVTFESPWAFPLMAELSICVDYRHPRLGQCRTPIRGVVVGTRKLSRGVVETTVLFDDPEERHWIVRGLAQLVD